jgi:hypothetical protein
MTTAHSHVLEQALLGVVRQDLYFGPIGLSYQRQEMYAYLQGSRRPTSTPLWSADGLFLGTAATRASGTALKQALPLQARHPCSNAVVA